MGVPGETKTADVKDLHADVTDATNATRAQPM